MTRFFALLLISVAACGGGNDGAGGATSSTSTGPGAGGAGAGGGGASSSRGGSTTEASSSGTGGSPKSEFDIPVKTFDDGTAAGVVVTVDLQIGRSKFTALLDTGSSGLRITTGTLNDADWTITNTQAAKETYGGDLTVGGKIATAVVDIGGFATPRPIEVEDITSVSCTMSAPNCPAKGVAPPDFRFRGRYPAIFGVGTRASTYLASPLAALATSSKVIVALDRFGSGTGVLHVNPSPSEMTRFDASLAHLMPTGVTSMGGNVGYDDTKVPFCLNAFCAAGLLDTGGGPAKISMSRPADYTALGVPNGSMKIPVGTQVTATIAAHAMWTFTVSNPTTVGVDAFQLGNGAAVGDNLGIAPFFALDVLYDFSTGTIGLASKE